MSLKFKWALALVLLFAGVAEAATYVLPNGSLPNGCSRSSRVVTCNNLNLSNDDIVNINGSALVTLNINGTANFSNAKVNVNGGPNKLAINVTGNLNSSTGVKIEANIVASTGKVTLGYNGTLIGNITANSATFGGENTMTGSVNVASSVNSTGNNVAISGGIEADSITLGNGSSVGGLINTINLTTGSNVLLSNVNAQTVSLGSSNTVNGYINATSTLTTGSSTQITGNINSPSVTLGSANTLNGSIDATNITIQASNSVVNGDLTASNNIALGSGAAINGNISAGGNITTNSPVTLVGNMSAGGDFTLASGSSVVGNVDAENITMAPSNSLITGDVSAANDVVLGSGNNIIGDVYGTTITLASSNAGIEGNATATALVTINWQGIITGNVTAPHIENNGGTIVGDIFCDTRTGLIRECLTASSGGTSGSAGIDSCSQAFSDMMGYGVIGDTSFTYGNKATINNTDITGSIGNSPTPSGQVAPVPTSFPGLQPSSFPSFNTGSTNKNNATNIAPGSYGEISTSNHSSTSGGTYYIDKVSLTSSSAKMTLAAGQYYINSVVLDSQSELLLDSGNYFINTVDIADQAEINLVPGASVNIFLGTSLASGTNSKINKNGTVSGLAIFLYSGASFTLAKDQGDHNNRFTGLIYSPFTNTTINIGEKTHYEGGIVSAGTVELGDKVKIDFDAVTTKEQILEAAGCSALPPDPVLDHYRIVLHEQELVSCYAAPVTIKACENASCSSPFVGAVTGEVNSTAANSKWKGVAANSAGFSFSGGEATLGLDLIVGGTTSVSLSNLAPATTNTTQCVDSTGTPLPNCNITFKTAGLLVSALSPFAGDDFNVTIRAVETNTETGACEARVEGSKTVNLGVECVNPSSCMTDQVFNANGTSVDLYNQGSSVPSTSVSLIFNAAGEATFNANYTDVGLLKFNASLDIAADASDPNVPEPATTLTGTGGVVVRPYTLIAQGLNDDLSPWTATAATGDGFKAAGENFFLAIQSLNAQGNPTPNFGNEIAAAEGSVAFHSIQFPTIAHDPSMASHLTFGQTFVPLPNVEGALVNQGVVWNEAGTVNLTAALTGNSYLGAGDAFERPARPVGRFYPHHFILKSSEVRNSCSVGDFSYMADPNIGINFEIHAVNKTDGLLTNYGNGDSSTTGHYVGSAVAGVNQTVYPLLGRLNSVFNAAWDKGILIEDLTTVAFARPASTTPDGPFDNLEVYIEMSGAEDGRGFVSSNNEKLQGSLSLKYGRMVLESVSGPEDQNLNVVLNTEFWNGTSFVINSSDRCTDFDPAELAIIPGTNPNSIESAPGLIAGVVHSGSVTPGELYWQEPTGGTLPGQFNFEYNAPEWLRFDWGRVGDLNGTNQNPQATAGFGLYRGNDKIIFSLERNF
ncbi:DUF6701 domain-containing protein [Aliidiomarina quisquiliarum]|uniref:DUF6701 domain-containing protein n=1 Tax=Aliidiomarina quisquiliarum TaxID=2938947 RepID=UPI00208FAF84|nr:DUF6701 domain-containing protein [Aliidiomarina quisquiliarum]MCO4322490.1 hypothetical protein [Aliidiomarina quisquiliarum]